MRRAIRFALPAALAAVVAVGCGKVDESKPNPDLKVPDVPPSGHGSKDAPQDAGKKK
jgi:hypothetical protein